MRTSAKSAPPTCMDELWQEATSASALSIVASPTTKARRLCVSGEQWLDFASAAYLGLDHDTELVEFACRILNTQGLGRSASPLYVQSPYYDVIQRRIARITGFPEVILFSSASLANYAALRVGVPLQSTVFADRFCHRSLVDGMRQARHRIIRYAHRDVQALEELLRRHCRTTTPVIVSDGIFSMSGMQAPVAELYRLSEERGGYLIVDDSHGFGVLGRRGEGTIGALPDHDHDHLVYTGSLNKGFPGCGGFIACSRNSAKRIRQQAAQYGFSCGIPALYSALVARMCQMIGTPRWAILVHRLKNHWRTLAVGLEEMGRPLLANEFSPMAVLPAADEQDMRRLCMTLVASKIAVNIVAFPAIPRGEFRIRLCLSASHTARDIDILLETISRCSP